VGRGELTLVDVLGGAFAVVVVVVHHVLTERRVRRITEALDRLVRALERRDGAV